MRYPGASQAGGELVEDGLFVRELAGLQLRVDQLPVEGQLKAAALAGEELELVDLLLVGGEQLGRQTDGLGLVVSHCAVLQLDFHVRTPRVNLETASVSFYRGKQGIRPRSAPQTPRRG